MAQNTLAYFCLFSVAVAAPAPLANVASNVKSDLVRLNRVQGGQLQTQAEQFRDDGANTKIPSGEALDLFYRFGFFSLSVRVVPREDSGSWLIREPTASIFQENTLNERITQGPGLFEPQFQIYFCDDVEELMEAYFRDFTAEGVDQPHKLFTGSWHKSTKSRYLGLSKATFESPEGVSFVLAKLPKVRATVQMTGTPSLKPEARDAIRRIRVGDEDSVMDFTKDYGSHLVRDVVVGDLIYQVFALTPDQYAAAKADAADILGSNSAQINDARFAAFYRQHLAPWQVKETGKIGVASGDLDVFRFVERELVISSPIGNSEYPNIFRLQEEPSLVSRLEALTSRTAAVVGMHFQSLKNWIPDPVNQDYYEQILDRQSALWEINL